MIRVFELTAVVGKPDPWWNGPGWYWADEMELLNGPCATQDEAIQRQAEHAFWLNPLPPATTVEAARAIGLKMRALLLSIPPDARGPDYENLREVALEALEVCSHCGADEQGQDRSCQCWNDE